MSASPVSRALRLLRRHLALVLVLLVTLVAVPGAGVRDAPVSLVKLRSTGAVDHPRDVVWILFLGSDARPGQSVTRSRADAIQLTGVNLRTGAATVIGVPRDSYVDIPGHGREKINASMYFGGPQLMGRSVGNLVGVQPNYVMTAGFDGFRRMVDGIGGVTVDSRFSFSDPVRPQGYHVGPNKLTGFQAEIFARIRKAFPRGDFDRSANQQDVLRGILRQVRLHVDEPGFMERGVLSVVRNLDTDLRPAELFRLAQAAATIDPARMRGCVVLGGVGYAGAASVVFPDVARARRIGDDVRRDATLDHGC
ncbi:LCP family protein [Nocardioides mesophilus]|uniref:LCP family protein n=1 Tax=Nocardioides mesophilus TaxID=433659 RepID=UPI001FE599B0|nr:LCP family protein [Nocardioides mesophilus]